MSIPYPSKYPDWQSNPAEYLELSKPYGDKLPAEAAPKNFEEKLTAAGEEITKLVVEKNRAYGNSVNKTIDQLRALFPNGVEPHKYKDLLLMIRVLDKFNRLSDGDPKAFGENPWRDIAGYGIIGMAQGDGE